MRIKFVEFFRAMKNWIHQNINEWIEGEYKTAFKKMTTIDLI